MANVVKYSLTTQANSLKKGNVVLGINSVEYGPTSATNYWNGVEVPAGGYVMYIPYSNGNGMTIYSMDNDTELIKIVNEIGLQSFTTAAEALAWAGQQTGLMLVNRAADNIITDGLVMALDAGFLSSYPATGTTWYNLGSDNTNGTLINGPAWDEDGYFEFDGTDDSVSLANIVQNSNSSTTIEVIMKSNSDIVNPNQQQMDFILSGATTGAVDAYNQFTMSTAGTVPLIILKSRVQYTSALSKYSYQVYYQILDIDMNNYPVVVQKYFNPNGSLFSEEIKYPQIINQTYSYIWSITNSDSGTRSIKHYLNGQQISVLGGAQTADFNFFNKNNLALGLRSNSNISILRLYNRALTAAEVLQNYYQAPIVTGGLVLAVDAGNLVSYESGSATVYPLAGSINGTLINGTSFSSDNGGYWSFDGANDYISWGDNFDLTATSISGTVWGWANSLNSYLPWIDKLGSNGNYRFHADSVGRLILGIRNTANAYHELQTASLISTNQWYYLAFTFDNSTREGKIYLNGELVGTKIYTIDRNDTSTPLQTGYQANNGGTLNGRIATLSLYNKALTPQEIQRNFNAQRARFGV